MRLLVDYSLYHVIKHMFILYGNLCLFQVSRLHFVAKHFIVFYICKQLEDYITYFVCLQLKIREGLWLA